MFGDLVAAYLFLGGTGGGACAVVGILGLLADSDDMHRGTANRFRDASGLLYGRFFGSTLGAAVVSLALGALCLLADVGRPDRVLLLMVSSPSTYLVIGTWALLFCSLLALLAFLIWRGVIGIHVATLRLLHGLLVLLGLAVVLYTGLFLASMTSVPLWNSPWLVVAFALSAFSCGLTLTVLSALVAGVFPAFYSVIRRLVRADTIIIGAEAATVALWLASVWLQALWAHDAATATDAAALFSVQTLCSGTLAPGLWLGLGIVGIALPAFMEVLSLKECLTAGMRVDPSHSAPRCNASAAGLALASSLCVLAGGACLRYLTIAAAVIPVPIPPIAL